MQEFTVTDEHAGKRLDIFLSGQFPNFTRSTISKLVDDGFVLVNKDVAPKGGLKLKSGDIISAQIETLLAKPPKIDLEILYEDNDCLVINKPAGVLTHSKGAYNPEATVASFIADKISPELAIKQKERAGIVHRLDRVTSGVIICAKSEAAHAWLQKQFSQRRTKKTYVAIIEGIPEPPEAIIDAPIARNPRKPQTFHVAQDGKDAQTHYRIVQINHHNSCELELKPVTGRTHQLRVHLQYIDHPIIGDPVYGSIPYKRLLLHAKSLELTLPNRQRRTFLVEPPKDFMYEPE